MLKFFKNFSHLSRRLQRVLTAASAVVAVFGIISYASIPDTNGVIHGCYKKSGGTLRVIDDAASQCDSRAESPIQWSQTGPQGPQGPQGPIGPQGPAGYSLATSVTSDSVSLPPRQFTQILSKDLPAGNWVISANAIVSYDNASAIPNLFLTSCQLRSGSTVIGAASDWGSEGAIQLVARTLPMNGIAALSEPGTVSVWCFASLGEGISFDGRSTSQMTIVRVGDVF